jgi:hypothetical protein
LSRSSSIRERLGRSRISKALAELRFLHIRIGKPSTTIVVMILLGFSIFLLGGGVYDILEKPMALLPAPGFPVFFYSGLQEQTLNESLQSIFLLTIGTLGCFVVYRSTRYAYRPRTATILLLIGLTLLILSFIGLEWVLALKGAR